MSFVVPGQALTAGTGAARQVLLFREVPAGMAAPIRGSTRTHAVRTAAPHRHRRSGPAPVRARLHGVERRQHQRAARRPPAADDANRGVQGLHGRAHDVHHRPGGQEARRGAESVVGNPDAPRGVSSAAGDPGRRPCASAGGDSVRGGRHPARPRRPGGGGHDARAAFRSPNTPPRPPASCRTRSASTSRLTTACCWPITVP